MSEQELGELKSHLQVDRDTRMTIAGVGGAVQGPPDNQGKLSSQVGYD